MNWERLEEILTDNVTHAIITLSKENPEHVFYGVAFYHCYREEGGEIHLPHLAANSIQTFSSTPQNNDNEGFWSIKWNPPDWKWTDIPYKNNELQLIEQTLNEEIQKGSATAYTKLENRFFKTVANASKKIRTNLSKQSCFTKDFVVFFHDEMGAADLAHKCMNDKLFLTHFPEQDKTEQERRSIAALPINEQVEYYISRLDKSGELIGREEAEEKLIGIGEPAIPILIKELDNPNISWQAAMLLGKIGISSDEVITTLRKGVLEKDYGTARHSTSALTKLGDIDYLLSLTNSDSTRETAICGITTLYGYSYKGKLDYAPLEKLLDKDCPKCKAIVEYELKPGSSYMDITANDVDEAIRGMGSRHQLIRQHATSVVGERKLGKNAIKKILPELIKRLQDKDPTVRRFAILSISWLGEEKSCISLINQLENDKDESIRQLVKAVQGDIKRERK